jgi:hypothetical protein
MSEPYYPLKALEVLRAARYDPDADYGFELLSGTFIWTDENYVEFTAACRANDNLEYWDPVAYRASVIRGAPNEAYRRGWEEVQRLCPDWPGLRPDRSSPTLREALEQALKEDF